MKEIQYEIVKEIAVLSKGDSGYTKEINLISWNADEAAALLEALQKEVNSGD